MQFNTVEYFLFLPIVLTLYYALGRRAQNVLLLIASYVFYGFWDWRFLGLIWLSTAVDFAAALAMDRGVLPKRLMLQVSVGTNLGILALFKYFDFFVESLAALMSPFGLVVEWPMRHVILPVGISFYTFQTMAYTIDVYRGKVRATSDLLLFALYVSFFPQLVAGPIERAQHLLPQLARARRVRAGDLSAGALLIFVGLLRKVAIADVVGRQVDLAFYQPDSLGSVALFAAVLAFALQIYGDFAGYSDIARGTARLMGIDLMVNFQHPYLATNITDFWRRWHISLSTWLRDYLYIPLGGSRRGARRTYVNLMATMLLGGLWHGAQWTFVAWGGIHGVALALHRRFGRHTDSAERRPGPPGIRAAAGWAATMAVVGIAWVFFRAPDFGTAFAFLHGLVAWRGGLEADLLVVPIVAAFGLLFLDLPQAWAGDHTAVARWPLAWRASFYLGGTIVLLMTKDLGNEAFIYFQF